MEAIILPAVDVVVTRHQGLVEFLVQEGIVDADIPVISHVTPEAIQGKHVIGILPLSLAAEAKSVTTVDMKLPAEMRGKELSAGDVRLYFTGINAYEVSILGD